MERYLITWYLITDHNETNDCTDVIRSHYILSNQTPPKLSMIHTIKHCSKCFIYVLFYPILEIMLYKFLLELI
jgi:hypothetical protein